MGSRAVKRNLVITALSVIFLFVVYYAWELYSAYRYTMEDVLPQEERADYPLQVTSLTDRQLEILLRIEDPKFYEHQGVDLSTPGGGLTTITQALVKHLYFDNFKSGIAKIKQTLIARYILDPLMPKDMQLRRFINTAYLGPESKGFEQAARHYFDKTFDQLSEDQFIAIVAMLVAPTTFNIEQYPERSKERVRRIKQVISGEYTPKGLCDLYYGKLDPEIQEHLAPFSYFDSYYE
jgi:membrane carboxypeptidase/penicillin-binding protein